MNCNKEPEKNQIILDQPIRMQQ